MTEGIAPPTLDLDKILLDIGYFGKYQRNVIFFMTLGAIQNSMRSNQFVFAAGPTEYRCKIPQCETSPPQYEAGPWAKFALPGNGKCYRYVSRDTTSCDPASFSNETEPCSSWVFQNMNTISYDFDLACQEWKRTLVGTLRSAAYFATMPFVSFFSDTFGRRYVLIFTALTPGFFGIFRSYANSYILYVVLEFIEAFIGSGLYSTVFIMALEMVNLKNRVKGGTIMSCTYALGLALLGVVAWNVRPWRTLTLILYAPTLLFILYFWVTKESVRWLMSKGRLREAAISILEAVKVNKQQLNVSTDATLNYFANAEDEFIAKEDPPFQTSLAIKPKKSLYKKVIGSKTIMCRLVVVSFWWITVTLVYYGLTINSVSLSGDTYLNFVLTSLIEIPGYIISMLALDRFGRKSSIMTAFLMAGISLLLIGAVSKHTVIIVLSMVGKLCVSITYSSIYIYTVELFPTEGRHQLMGFCSMVGRLGSMAAPQTPLLMAYSVCLPYVLFGGMSIVAGMLMLLAPETLKLKLPDTFEEAENMNLMPRSTRRADVLKSVSESEMG